MRFFSRTPVRSFLLYPLLVIVWEIIRHKGSFEIQPLFLPLMLWGYLQYRLCGLYRIKHGGGGPGLETPPERLVATGPYAYTRNPMYLGHIIYLTGLSLTLQSWFAAVIRSWLRCGFIGGSSAMRRSSQQHSVNPIGSI